MGGKGGYGKTLENKGRDYRLQRSKTATAVGTEHARTLSGKRLGDAAKSALAKLEADKRQRRFGGESVVTHKASAKPAPVAPAPKDSDSDVQPDEEELALRQAEEIRNREYRNLLAEDRKQLRDAVERGIEIIMGRALIRCAEAEVNSALS
jgi:hypothetical protein